MYCIDWNLNIFMSSSLSPSKRYIVTLDYQTDQKYDKITKWEVGKGICWSQFVISISSRHAIFNILKFWNFPKNPSQCNVQYHSGLNDPYVAAPRVVHGCVGACMGAGVPYNLSLVNRFINSCEELLIYEILQEKRYL